MSPAVSPCGISEGPAHPEIPPARAVISVALLQEGCGVINEVHFSQLGAAELEEMFTQLGHVPVCNQALPGAGFGVFKLGLNAQFAFRQIWHFWGFCIFQRHLLVPLLGLMLTFVI